MKLYKQKIIEHMEVDFILSRLINKININVLDIGSHNGEFLDIFSNYNHSHKWKVICVEPIRKNRIYIYFKKFKYFFLKIKIIPCAISDSSGIRNFFIGNRSTLITCEPEWVEENKEYFHKAKNQKIETLTINDMFDKYHLNKNDIFDLVKVDVEGHDLNVVNSLCNSTIQFNSIIFEFSKSDKTGQIIDKLKKIGFIEFYIFGRIGIPTTFIGPYINQDSFISQIKDNVYTCGNIVGFK